MVSVAPARLRGAEAEFYLPKRSRERSCERDSFQRTSPERSDKRLGSFCSSPYARTHARSFFFFLFFFLSSGTPFFSIPVEYKTLFSRRRSGISAAAVGKKATLKQQQFKKKKRKKKISRKLGESRGSGLPIHRQKSESA